MGVKQPNQFGLYDMHGGVWEWCQNLFDEAYYAQFAGQGAVDPPGPETQTGLRAFRGASWGDAPPVLRAAKRHRGGPNDRGDYVGFRVMRMASDEQKAPPRVIQTGEAKSTEVKLAGQFVVSLQPTPAVPAAAEGAATALPHLPAVSSVTPESLAQVKRFSGHRGIVGNAVFSPDGHTIASSSEDGTVRLWDMATSEELKTFTGHTEAVWCVRFALDGRFLFSGGGGTNDRGFIQKGTDHAIRMWNIESGKTIKRFEGHTDRVTALAASWNSAQLLSGGDDGTVRLWEISSGRELRQFSGPTKAINCVAFSPV